MPAQNLKRLNTKMFLPKSQKKNVRILRSVKRDGRVFGVMRILDIKYA